MCNGRMDGYFVVKSLQNKIYTIFYLSTLCFSVSFYLKILKDKQPVLHVLNGEKASGSKALTWTVELTFYLSKDGTCANRGRAGHVHLANRATHNKKRRAGHVHLANRATHNNIITRRVGRAKDGLNLLERSII
jgi:L-amino acid N-acyltransferase YncA